MYYKYLFLSLLSLLTISCNRDHNEDPYISLPIVAEFEPEILAINWDDADATLKSEIKEMVKSDYIINSAYEIPDFELFEIPDEIYDIDFSRYTLLLDFNPVDLSIISQSYWFYKDNKIDAYVLNTNYITESNNTSDSPIMYLSCSAVAVNKLPGDATVKKTYSITASGLWD